MARPTSRERARPPRWPSTTLDERPVAADEPPAAAARAPAACSRFLTTTDHKRIGIALHGHRLRLLPARRGAGRGDPHRAVRARARRSSAQGRYNEIFTMHGSIMMFLFLGPVRLRAGQLPRAAADRRPGHGVPPAQRPVVLVLPVRRPHDAVRASSPPTAPPTSAGPATRRCRTIVRSPGLGGDLWIMAVVLTGLSGVLTAVNIVATVVGHAGPGHDDVPACRSSPGTCS